ncbi:MAG TPA: hypothetical protein VGH86_08705 [Phenylobacterium sp.]|jgi:hypothetical protein
MRKLVLAAASAALVLAGGQSANAQFGHHSQPQTPPGAQGVDCAKIASMPNAPMTLEACLKMTNSATSMQRSMNDPAGMRPGDEAMTCDQIKAELMTSGGIQMNRGHVAQAQSAATDFQTKQAQVQRESQALVAEETATNAAASAAGNVPFAGKAAQAAADAKNTAESNAFNAHAQKTLNPAQQALSGSTATLASDMAANLQNDPRKARLISLAGAKNCH